MPRAPMLPRMPAYVLADITVTDPGRYEDYKPLSSAAAEKYGGRFVARGGATQVLEGDWPAGRFVMIEFPDTEAARRWYDSPEYREARAVRQEASTGRLLLVEGAG